MKIGQIRKKYKKIILYLVAIFILGLWMFPLFWVFLSSFKPVAAFGRKEITWFFKPSLENFIYVFKQFPFPSYLRNSIIVALCSTFLSVILGSLAGYSIARFHTGGKFLSLWILSTRMLPPAAIILPFFMMFSKLGLVDTIFGLVISYLVFNLSFSIWMSNIFFREVPVEIEEAAMIDGCSRLEAFFRVTLPLARPGIISVAIFCLVFSWNEFLFSLVLTNSKSAQTLPASVGRFVTKYQIIWGPLFAESLLIILPILVATMVMQRYLIRGMTLGAIK